MSAEDHVRRATALGDIAQERSRQVESEGWTPEHDDGHSDGELATAAACYASPSRAFRAEQRAGRAYEPFTAYIDLWPWADKWWKPKSRREDLVRAAALIVAEIERLDRANPAKPGADDVAGHGTVSPRATEDTPHPLNEPPETEQVDMASSDTQSDAQSAPVSNATQSGKEG